MGLIRNPNRNMHDGAQCCRCKVKWSRVNGGLNKHGGEKVEVYILFIYNAAMLWQERYKVRSKVVGLKGILTDVEYVGHSEKRSKLGIFFFFLLLYEAHFPKGMQAKIILVWNVEQFSQKSLVHKTLFNTVVCGSNESYIIMHNLKTQNWSTEILEIKFFFYIFWFISTNMILLESLTIPLKWCRVQFKMQ